MLSYRHAFGYQLPLLPVMKQAGTCRFAPQRNSSCSRSRAKTLRAGATASEGLVTVSWRMQHRCRFGEHVAIVGGHEQLGSWDPKKAVALQWREGDEWVGNASFGAGVRLEYKYIVRQSDCSLSYWQSGPNCDLEVATDPGARILVVEGWSDSQRKIEVEHSRAAMPPVVDAAEASHAPAVQSLVVPTKPEGKSPLALQADSSMADLKEVMARHKEIQNRVSDPTALEVLQADRLMAAANNKAVAMNKALKAADALPQLPSATQR